MRSSEIARIAGVTVRTLRHYHRVGILAEPERSANGYRRYSAADLVRLLRIRRLVALGVPLDRIVGILDSEGADSAELLDELDRELAAEIGRLQGQRAVVALLKAGGVPPDLPPEMAPFIGVLAGLSPELDRMDRDQSVLLAHLVGAEGMPRLVEFYQRVEDAFSPQHLLDLTARFSALGADASEEEIAALVELFSTVVQSAVVAFDGEPRIDLTHSQHIFDELTSQSLNAAQQEVFARLEALEEAR